ncbi:MAG TPA: CbbBc protein [Gemmatimonadetes bacterium]|nr:CbbBc protein [Gemmatimonadota bacterium]HBV06862.1 CbbBc protein [Gemmatimonadota bacterium]|tara:strand:+ start:1845 stop:4106 length:2262 start_codon:yes stop_codon:yes gene_type:complete
MKNSKNGKAAGGLGALKGTWETLRREKTVREGSRALLKVNQPDGFDCPGCAWPEPDSGAHSFEFCENGAKAVAAETTSKRVDPSFLEKYSVTDLLRKSDFWLEQQGRLTHPMILEEGSNYYRPISWDDAFNTIGKQLRALPSPDHALFYTSGRTSNEAAFLYQLLARRLGTNNLPDCSNLCHESSGVGLGESIGVGKGTVQIRDFDSADAIFVIGQNPGTNHPRMLATLQEAARRGARIICINPLKERGLVTFTHPKEFLPTLGMKGTAIATHYLQPVVGSDIALLKGMMKHLLMRDRAENKTILDWAFIHEHTSGFDDLREDLEGTSWDTIVDDTGLSQSDIEEVADIYADADASIVCWAMGITQHVHGVHNVQAIANLLLLKGNIGRPGAGACPVRGHSNVQGDRTMGIIEKPKKDFLDRLGRRFGFDPPKKHGLAAIRAIESMVNNSGQVFIGMGGNFAQATSDTEACHKGLRNCVLTVHVSTKLNRSHLVHGKTALILPCLARSEQDVQASGPQKVTVEDSMGVVHASQGHRKPPSPHLRSEPAIVAGIARAAQPNDHIGWEAMVDDYAEIRKAIEVVIPAFEGFEEKIKLPGGFPLHNSASNREWATTTGKARFIPTPSPDIRVPEGHLRLFTIRSHDQYNTTIYGLDDRYRGIKGDRMVVFLHPGDMKERLIEDGDRVDLFGIEDRGLVRRALGFRAVEYDVPRGCCAAYFPETNSLVPLWHRAHRSETPASKFIPIIIKKAGGEKT